MSTESLGHRISRWLWRGRGPLAGLARGLLLPVALLYRVAVTVRTRLYHAGILRSVRLPLPTVAVGNLSLGGAGKTPVAAWIAGYAVQHRLRPGVLLRGYGGDEPLVHQRLVPQAIVVADPDRAAGAAAAAAKGAQLLVLDDAYQHLGVRRDLNVLLVAVERARQARWPFPAGPWREGWSAMERADVIVVTRKRAAQDESRALADAVARRWPRTPVCVAHLRLSGFQGMRSGTAFTPAELAGRRVFACAGVADPESFGVQVRGTGAAVQLASYQDHHRYDDADVVRLVRAARESDYVVVTEKDAVKLRPRWPADAPEPLVAVLGVQWEWNGAAFTRALDAVLAEAGRPSTGS